MTAWSPMKLTNAIGYAGLLILAGLLFYPLGMRLLTGKWPNTVSFSRTIDLRAHRLSPTRLPYSHHDARGGGSDFFLFDEAGERYASEEPLIEADRMFWKVRRPFLADDHEQRIFLLQPFSVIIFFVTHLVLFFLLSVVWVGFLGWCTTKLAERRELPKLIN